MDFGCISNRNNATDAILIYKRLDMVMGRMICPNTELPVRNDFIYACQLELENLIALHDKRLSDFKIEYTSLRLELYRQSTIINHNRLIDRQTKQEISEFDMNGKNMTQRTQKDHTIEISGLQLASDVAKNQSKEKSDSKNKNRINYIRISFQELYMSLVLFEQYIRLYMSNFERILEKHDRVFASKLGRKFYQDSLLIAKLYHPIDQLIESIEYTYTLHFNNGNHYEAIEELNESMSRNREQSSPLIKYRVGFDLGCFVILTILLLVVGYPINTSYDWRLVFRLYRSSFVIIIFLFQTGISIIIWRHYKINYLLIFQLDPRENQSYLLFFEYGSFLGVIWSLSMILFLYSETIGLRPSLCPFLLLILIFLYLVNPISVCNHRSRYWLLEVLYRIFTAPFHKVRFIDYWIADQFVSIVPLFLDLEYIICFYFSYDGVSQTCNDPAKVDGCLSNTGRNLLIRTLVGILPAWLRCLQCIRLSRDNSWKLVHLANAAKYGSMVVVILLANLAQSDGLSFRFDTMRTLWIVLATLVSIIAAGWDMVYDFGVFEGRYNKENTKDKKETRLPFLRGQILYPAWFYYFAIIEDWILKFGWLIYIMMTYEIGIEPEYVFTLTIMTDLFSKIIWNIIKIENEWRLNYTNYKL